MIMPKTLYITLNFDLGIDDQSEWVFENGNIAVNGRTAKESEILLNLLINFIFDSIYTKVKDSIINPNNHKTFGNIYENQ